MSDQGLKKEKRFTRKYRFLAEVDEMAGQLGK